MAILQNLPPYLIYWHAPEPIFVARVNLATPIYPIQDIPFDGVTVGTYTDLSADMFFTLGSAEGLDDAGRGRLRAAPTSTVLKVGRSSEGTEDGQLSVVNDYWIHVYPAFNVHSKIPVIGTDYNEFKDTDIAVSDLTQQPPPVATLGPDRARRIDTGTGLARLYFDGGNSYAVADAATIVSYAWDIDDGTFVLGTSATDSAIYADFPAGVRYVALTVTDSNGKSHSGRRLVLAHDPANSLCVSGMQVQRITRTDKGLSVRLRVLQDLPRASFPDGAHILVFEDRDPAIYGTPDPTDWSDTIFTGWHSVDEASSTDQETHLRRETLLTCVDVLGRLDGLPGFPQRLEVPDEEEGLTWGEMPAVNMDKFLVYLIHWHSTAASVADFYPSGTWDEYPFVLFDASGDTLYNQLQRQAARIVPDHNFTSDRYGRMEVVVNPQYQNPADRTSTVQYSLTEQGWSAIEFTYNRNPRVHTLRGSALLTQTEWLTIDDDKALVEPVFAIAPGTAPGQGGREQKLGERLAQSQADLNDTIGHHYARMNARYGDIIVTLNLNADPWDFNPAAFTWVTLHTTAATAPQRGLDFTTIRTLCKEVSIDYTYGEEATTWRGRVVLEPETVGLPALTEVHKDALPVGTQPTPFVPPDFGLVEGVEVLAAFDADATNGPLYRTADFQTVSGSGGPTWAQVDLGLADTRVYSFVVDPFSPGYINGSGAINAWLVTEAAVYRVTDVFGATPGVTTQHTFAVPISASSVFQTRTIQASFGRYFPTESDNPWLMVVSHYANAAGHTGTWATYSLDAGATWSSEVLITPHFDTDMSGAEPRVEVGVYLSPKTPGLAYTTAYTTTGSPGTANGFFSTDWGATWGEMVVDEVDAPAPWWGLLHEDGTLHATHKGARFGHTAAISGGPQGGTQVDGEWYYLIAPPADAVRVEVSARYTNHRERSGSPNAAFSQSYDDSNAAAHTKSSTLSFTPGAINGADSSQDFTITWTKASGTVWSGNRDQLQSTPPAVPTNYCRIRSRVTINTGATGTATATNSTLTSAEITEIELAGGEIYDPRSNTLFDPGNRPSGAIHVPWADNDNELLVLSGKTVRGATLGYGTNRAAGDGVTIADISPVESAVNYGPHRSGFSVRAYDSNRIYLVMGASGNDASAVTTDDDHAVFVSDDGGDTWALVLGPTADTSFGAVKGYSAAFAGDTEQVLFIFGASDQISYSSDFGSSIDPRSGNLSSFGVDGFVGICGGPG